MRPDQVREKDERALEHTDDERRLTGEIVRDLGAELCDFWGLPSTVKDSCLNHCMVREDFVDERIYIMRRTVTAADLLSELALESLREDVQLEIRDILSVILHRSDDEVSGLLGEFIGWRPEVERMAAI